MTNQYFNHDNAIDRHTLGRAELVNAIFEAVVAGFDKLPNPDLINQAAQTYAEDTGAANAYVVSLPTAPQAYTAGLTITMRAANANTGASTINVDGLGAKTIKRYNGDPLIAGDILVGQLVVLGYDGTDFRMMGVHPGEVVLSRQWATSLSVVADGLKGARGYAQDAAQIQQNVEQIESDTQDILDEFRGIYYGPLASDPTEDPNGNPPSDGDFYYNNTLSPRRFRSYDAGDDAWYDMGVADLRSYIFTASGGETSVSGNDDNGNPLIYSPGFIVLYLNGARLEPGVDYIATNGTTITGLSALSPGDEIAIDAFSKMNLSQDTEADLAAITILANQVAADRIQTGQDVITAAGHSQDSSDEADRSTTQANRSENEADRAEAAADAAALNAGVYADTAAGLAATSEGDYFSAPSAEDREYLILYLHETGPVATEIKRYPSAEAVQRTELLIWAGV